MTNPDLTHLVLLVDRSGSMDRIAEEAEKSVRALIAEQREQPGELAVTLFQFDDRFDEISDIDSWHLQPRGLTALHDAIGRSIILMGKKFKALPEDDRPGTVIFQITTDGLENASTEFDGPKVAEMISRQTDTYAWVFHYSGANQHAVTVARGLNIPTANAVQYAGTPEGVAVAYASASRGITISRLNS